MRQRRGGGEQVGGEEGVKIEELRLVGAVQADAAAFGEAALAQLAEVFGDQRADEEQAHRPLVPALEHALAEQALAVRRERLVERGGARQRLGGERAWKCGPTGQRPAAEALTDRGPGGASSARPGSMKSSGTSPNMADTRVLRDVAALQNQEGVDLHGAARGAGHAVISRRTGASGSAENRPDGRPFADRVRVRPPVQPAANARRRCAPGPRCAAVPSRCAGTKCGAAGRRRSAPAPASVPPPAPRARATSVTTTACTAGVSVGPAGSSRCATLARSVIEAQLLQLQPARGGGRSCWPQGVLPVGRARRHAQLRSLAPTRVMRRSSANSGAMSATLQRVVQAHAVERAVGQRQAARRSDLVAEVEPAGNALVGRVDVQHAGRWSKRCTRSER